MRFSGKLAVLVAAPLVAVVGFAALAVITTGGAAVRADGLRRLVAAAAMAGDLTHRLQAERAAALVALTEKSAHSTRSYVELVAAGEEAATGWARVGSQLPALPAAMATIVARLDGQLARLGGLRERVRAGQDSASAVAFTYRIVIADLITFRELVAQAGGAPADVADHLRAAAALSGAAEALGLGQVAVLRAARYGPLSRTAAQEITAARTTHAEALLTFDAFAIPAWRALLERSASGAEAVRAQQLEDQVARIVPGARLRIDATQWAAATTRRMLRLGEVESAVDSDILTEVTNLRDAQRRATAWQIAAVAAAVTVALLLAVWLGRPVVQGLRQLRDAAHQVAYQGLPAAVAKLDSHDALGGLTPEQFADQAPAPVRVRGGDELAEVARAFNAVHRSALRVAAEQALLRVGIAAIFLNLARRGQQLAGRLAAELDAVERDEEDPKRLEQLFRLDLLATLLTRTNDSLLVLGGSARARPRSGDVPLLVTLRAAQSQVEDYARIEFGAVDDGVTVRAAAVDDVIKLLAELMDNACRYSMPQVMVYARRLVDRVVIQVTDEGIGISEERRRVLNQRLATRAPLDETAVRTMGLTVVGHIAARLRIRVELLAAAPYGTIAEVVLHAGVFTVAATNVAELATAPGLTWDRDRQARPLAPLFQPVPAGRRVPLPRPPAEPLPAPSWSHVDDTTALPIFEAARSASPWFDASARGSAVARHMPTDAGWQAAERAAMPPVTATSRHGLPQRAPMAQLVPGAVEATATQLSEYRDPARVSATWTAYARGLAAGRAGSVTGTSHTSTE